MIKEDELPIFNWVWFGLYRSEGGLNGYTYGMDVFGKEEMEVLNTDAEPEDLRDFLASLASYVLACDVTLQDGETIGFSADDKHTITRSPGVSLPEEQMTLKISYEPTEVEPETDDDSIGMDDVSYHIESIEEKELPIDPINAYNHMAIYLRWCMEHDLMGGKFLAEHGEVVNQVKADPGNTDLRTFIREELFGCLFSALFNQQGRAFAGYYYGEGDSPYYPADIDDYALKYFGPSRYHSNEFQQEAYLFIPFDEDYYQAMAEVIEERFTNWQGQDFDEDTLEPSEVAQAIMEYLDCECTYFPSMADDDPIMSAYSYARRLGVREGFVPVLIQADDETQLECLVMNADPEHDADFYEFDLKTVEEYRKKMLSAPIKDGKAILEELTGQRKEEAEDDDLDWDEEVLGEMEGGEPNDRFANYWNDDTGMTYPLILAKIPVKNPWEIFAYLPFGNWNECPDTPDLMAVAKYWFEQHGAIPAAMSHDELEFELPTPISKERAMEVAVEQYSIQYSYSLLSEHLLFGFQVEIPGHFKSVAVASQFSGSPERCTAAGARVDDHISGIGKDLDQAFQHGHRFLGRMDLRIVLAIPFPVKPIEDHVGLTVRADIVELGELAPVQHQRIFRCAHDFHVGFQDLWAVVLAERQRDVVFESVLLRLGDDLRNLLECTEHDHAGCALLAFHRLLFQKSIAEVEVLRDVEREIRVECSFPSFATLAVPIVAIHIPVRPAGVEV